MDRRHLLPSLVVRRIDYRHNALAVELLALHPLFAQKNKRVFMKWTNGWLNMTRMAEKLIEKGVRLRSLPLLHEI